MKSGEIIEDAIGQGKAEMRLADFIHDNTKEIVTEWENFARTLMVADSDKSPFALRDHIQEILTFIIKDIQSEQSHSEQIEKSQGRKSRAPHVTAAETHAAIRLAGGFNIDQMVSEYRALRASVIKLWGKTNPQMNSMDVIDLTRFNESIDQEMAESVSHYTQRVSYSKDLFVGILSHELRNPLNVIAMSAQLMMNMGSPNDRQNMLAAQISDSTARIATLIDDLLDMTRARFGSGFLINRAPMDMEFVSRQMVDEIRAKNYMRKILLDFAGDGKGHWDKARIGQVFSNLIGNAIQYSFTESPIDIHIKCDNEEVQIAVHNQGLPIAEAKLETIFDSLSRAVTDQGEHPGAVNLGLGLYITKEIIIAHGGSIDVTSSEENGTTFTVRLPKGQALIAA